MSVKRAAETYDAVVRKIKFLEEHPHVRIDHRTAPAWHWEASWIRHDGTETHKVQNDLGALLNVLDRIDWAQERPQRPPAPPLRPPSDGPDSPDVA